MATDTILCHCGDPQCDTDCGERAAIYRAHRREQLRDIELDPEDLCPSCGGYIGSDGICHCDLEA